MTRIGIQGGDASFNFLACQHFISRRAIPGSEIIYLYTTKNVLKALSEQSVDLGVFAESNTLSGRVESSYEAIQEYDFDHDFEILEEVRLRVSHSLFGHPEISFSEIDSVITHSVVLKQCKNTLNSQFPNLKLEEGQGDFEDPSRVAQGIARGELPKNVATLSRPEIAKAYGLKIFYQDLEDSKDNFTRFVLVRWKV